MTTEVKAANVDNTYRSDHEMSRDSSGTRDRAAGDSLKAKAGDAGQSLQETGQSIAEKSKHAHRVVCDFTKDNPTAAVLLAFSLGTILVRILPGR